MGFFSFFKRKRITKQTGFRSYQNVRSIRRKPFVPKKTAIRPIDRKQRRAHKRQTRIWIILKILSVLLLLAAAIYGAFGTRLFEIQKIDIEGSAETLNEQASVQEYMQDFLGKNMLLLNAAEHEDTLIEQYSYLKEINIVRRPFHTLIAKLVTYDHIANVQVEYEDGSKQFFIVNELGSIASIGTTDETLPTIVMDVTGTDIDLPTEISEDDVADLTSKDLSVNQELLPPETLETLLETKEKFEGKFNMQVMEMHYLKCARELHLFTERYFFVWIDLTQDVNTQLSKLKKAMTQLNIYEAPLEYIDLRVSGQGGEKVIYKLSEE